MISWNIGSAITFKSNELQGLFFVQTISLQILDFPLVGTGMDFFLIKVTVETKVLDIPIIGMTCLFYLHHTIGKILLSA